MSPFIRSIAVCVGVWSLAGCDLLQSTLDKQTKACVADVKLGLGDPESLEILTVEEIVVNGGGHRLKLKFTAKNSVGGRVRGEALCGFKDKSSTELYADDIWNRTRTMNRQLNELGVRVN